MELTLRAGCCIKFVCSLQRTNSAIYLQFISFQVSSQRQFIPIYFELNRAFDLASRAIEFTRFMLMDFLTVTQTGFIFTPLIGKPPYAFYTPFIYFSRFSLEPHKDLYQDSCFIIYLIKTFAM
jgi:hypothetical protein